MAVNESATPTKKNQSTSGALFIALGIFFSRVAGLVRERALAHYFGNSDTADAFKAALKIPNFLQNLFGEGALSASFIPVYSELLSKGKKEEAIIVAKTIFSFLLVLVSLLVVLGVYMTPMLIDLIAPGFNGEKKTLTIQLVQILFPGTGLLVLSAWCLGVLNSHRHFFMSYIAPVAWNFTIILAVIIFGSRQIEKDLIYTVTWSVVAGSFLQFIIQLPTVRKYISILPLNFDQKNQAVKTILKNFGPALLSRGIVQISSYIDNIIASLLKTGAVSGIAFAQTIYTLPVSLFGMSISQAELTNFSQVHGNEEEKKVFLLQRLEKSLKRLNFFIIPTVVVFLLLGDILVSALFQTGQFNEDSTRLVWFILMGSTVGLLASTKARLLSSCFYALKNTKTPMYIAIVRVITTTLFGLIFSLKLPAWLGIDDQYAAALLTLSFGISGQIEFFSLKFKLQKIIGKIQDSNTHLIKIFAISFLAALPAVFLRYTEIWNWHPIPRAVFVLSPFAIFYLAFAYFLKEEEVVTIIQKILKKFKR